MTVGGSSRVSRRVWTDRTFLTFPAPAPNGRVLWLYLLTADVQGPIPGLFRAGVGTVADSLGWDHKETGDLMGELEEKGMIRLSVSPPLIWLPKALLHGKPASPNVVKSWRKAYEELPETPLREEAMTGIRELLSGSYQRAWDETFWDLRKGPGDPSRKGPWDPSQSTGNTRELGDSGGSPHNIYVLEGSNEGVQIAKELREAIRTHSPQVARKYDGENEKRLSGWALELDKLMRIDRASPGDVRRVIRWAHKDDARGFWRPNLLSGSKVRKHFDQILLQAKAGGAPIGRDLSAFGAWMDENHGWLLRWRDEREALGEVLDTPALLAGCNEEGIPGSPEPERSLRWLERRR